MSLSVHIEKKLGAFSLKVEFETQGERMALLGLSGSGKSMTLKCIAGIETPDAGRIVLDGRVLFDSEKRINLPPQKRQVGYLFQNYALFPHMTVLQNLRVGAPKGTDLQAALARFQLEGLGHLRPAQLSGGQQQRVALARILLNQPRCLLLDEPFAALDRHLALQMEWELSRMLEQFGGDILFVSHHSDEVRHLCDTVCVLSDGTSVETTTVSDLFSAPKTVAAARLAGYHNIAQAERLDEHRVFCPQWGVTLRSAAEIPENCTAVAVKQLRAAVSGEENTAATQTVGRTRDGSLFVLQSSGGGLWYTTVQGEICLPPEEILPLL